MTEKISLKDIFVETLGRKVRSIKTGSELLLVYELAKYLKLEMDKELDFDIPVIKELLQGADMTFCVHQSLDLGVNEPFVDRENLPSIGRTYRFYFTESVANLHFEKDTDDQVVYCFDSEIFKNGVLHGENRSYGYISLIGYLMIRAFKRGIKMPKLLINHSKYRHQELEYVHLYILSLYGNRFTDGIVTLEATPVENSSPIWEAYYIEHNQRGHMLHTSTPQEKYKFLKRNFTVGDVVLLYKKSPKSKRGSLGVIDSCYPAIIKAFDAGSVRVEYYSNFTTYLTNFYHLDMVKESMDYEGTGGIYKDEDYLKFPRMEETFDIIELGVCELLRSEESFILEPIETDGTYQYLKTPTGASHLFLNTIETIYAVFEDRQVAYNKDRFLERYMKGKTPIYEQYKLALEGN